MTKWKCDACGTVHRSNVRKCRNCGHTVLSPYRGDEEPGAGGSGWLSRLKAWFRGWR